MMKTFLHFVAATLLIVTTRADATPSQLTGAWRGNITFYFSTLQLGGLSQSVAQPFEGGSLVQGYVVFPNLTFGQSTSYVYDNGTIWTVVTSNGAVVGYASGTWYSSGNTVYENVTAWNAQLGSYTQSVQSTLVNDQTIYTLSGTSYGAWVTGYQYRVNWDPAYGWTRPVDSNGNFYTSSLGTVNMNPEFGGWVWSWLFGWVNSNRSGSSDWFWSNSYGWVYSDNWGAVWIYATGQQLLVW